ncbi:transposable element Tc1 transposase [Trichonephila clavipes]|uniref:Transposable element Tc1 transposase n=1 Tax=Trichonephila clavipes TaxID=2585209 RepID=A0A8X7BCJ6_TRICX|nr:transposable element Tc1 transposase [Trichonephila clavipes]
MNRLTPEQRFQIVQFYFKNNGRARDFHKRILFSDEAHFWLNGYVNKQNCRIWSEANPQVYVETPLHPEKLTVWCALWAEIVGAVDRRRYPRVENRVWSDQKDPEDRMIVRKALVDPTVTRLMKRAEVSVTINPQTISRHLAEANLKSNRLFRVLPLTPEHQRLRLQWCQARSMWNVTDWQKVVFSDESRFVFGTDDNHVRVWRCPDSSMAGPLPRFVPCRARVGSAKTADAIVSLCTGFRVGCSLCVGPYASGQDKESNQLNAGPCGGMYCSWRWSNALLNLFNICVVAYPVFV